MGAKGKKKKKNKKRKKKKKKKKGKDIEMMLGASLLFLPEDILVFNILVTLPVVDIIRCTSVCKQWYCIIQTPYFISAHFSLSSSFSPSSSSQPMQVVHHYCYTRRRHVLSSGSDPESLEVRHTVPFSFLSPESLIVFGPIRGLFFLCKDNDFSPSDDEFYCLWNPSVRRYIPLPSPIFDINNVAYGFGFGFDHMNRDYKVVVLRYLTEMDYNSSHPLTCQLFSLKEGCWRTVGIGEYGERCVALNVGCFVNEALHWVAEKDDYNDDYLLFVLAFNIAHENFKEIEFPPQLHSSHEYGLLEIKESLACFDYGLFDPIEEPQGVNCYSIWVMKEYGMANSWVKMWTYEQMGALLCVHGLWGFGDEILVETEDDEGYGHLFLYDTKTHKNRDFGGDAELDVYSICDYTESLILLDEKSGAVSY